MNATLKSKVSEVLTKYNFSPEDARFLSDVLQEIDDRQRSEFEANLDQLLTQKDKTELIDRIQKMEASLVYRMQQDKTEVLDRIQKIETSLTKQVYIVGLIQFLAFVGAFIGIINFALK